MESIVKNLFTKFLPGPDNLDRFYQIVKKHNLNLYKLFDRMVCITLAASFCLCVQTWCPNQAEGNMRKSNYWLKALMMVDAKGLNKVATHGA